MPPDMPAAPDDENPLPTPWPEPPPLNSDTPQQMGPEQPAEAPPRPWGFWATLGWGLLIALGSLIAQGLVGFIAGASGVFSERMGKITMADVEKNGFLLAIGTLAAAPVICGLTFLVARLRRQMELRTYLGLCWPGLKSAVRWTGAFLILLAVFDSLTQLLGKSIVPEFMVNVYKTAGSVPLLFLAILVGAPLWEEFFFRGFLLEGFRHSRLGNFGAVLLTSVLWAALHVQYDIYGISAILMAGIFLGYARIKTGSIWLCVWLHSFMSLIASIELLVYLRLKG